MEIHQHTAVMPTRRFSKDLAKLPLQMMVLAMVIVACDAQAPGAAAPTSLSPAPAPAPVFENVTQLLVYGGDYSTFISMMIETKVDVIFQRMANETDTGVTIFAPTNEAFKTKLATTLLKQLTAAQKVSLVEYHALNDYKSLEDLQNSNQNQTATLASYNNGGGRYLINITFGELGVVQILSDWTLANMTTMVYSSSPVSIFAINQVLFPEDIFGFPAPAPAPTPSSGAPTPTPSSSSVSSSSSTSGPANSDDSSFAPPSFTPSVASLFMSFFFFGLLMTWRL